MKNMFSYEIRPRKEDYRLEILGENPPELFFALNYSSCENGKIKCYADISGYSSINSKFELPSRIAIDILIALLKEVIDATDRYMLPWDYVIDTSTVFVNRKGTSVKLIYKPRAKNSDAKNMSVGTTSAIILGFIKEFVDKIAPGERGTFLRVMEMFFKADESPENCLRNLYKLKDKMTSSLDLSR